MRLRRLPGTDPGRHGPARLHLLRRPLHVRSRQTRNRRRPSHLSVHKRRPGTVRIEPVLARPLPRPLHRPRRMVTTGPARSEARIRDRLALAQPTRGTAQHLGRHRRTAPGRHPRLDHRDPRGHQTVQDRQPQPLRHRHRENAQRSGAPLGNQTRRRRGPQQRHQADVPSDNRPIRSPSATHHHHRPHRRRNP
ncbi:Uncharacterised protein [Mycobacteroides abscessus subsp. abscessus]|nr:Uncharacterised protein [Mycobacteroides abscessus subsp. abscessus]